MERIDREPAGDAEEQRRACWLYDIDDVWLIAVLLRCALCLSINLLLLGISLLCIAIECIAMIIHTIAIVAVLYD